MNYYEDKNICVTGAGGSIGSALTQRLLDLGARVYAVCRSEDSLYRLTAKVLRSPQTRYVGVLGDIRDRALMDDVLGNCDMVINAAAHKHVPLCEQNPVEAANNNILGTESLIRSALRRHVRQFVQISTDKAVNPTSVMGMTKRVCEKLIDDYALGEETKFCVVRFGNVLDSSGSVLPLWRDQVARGVPITLTDKRCTRYFMSIPEAVELVLNAADIASLRAAQGIYVLDMGEPRSLYEMAKALGGKIRITGLRPGEKLTEELHHGGQLHSTEHPKIFQVQEPGFSPISALSFGRLVAAIQANDAAGVRRELARMTA